MEQAVRGEKFSILITLHSDIILKSTNNKSDEVFKLKQSLKHFFGSTYQRERSFPQLKVNKTKYRSILTDENVKKYIILGCTHDYQPDFRILSANVDSQVSHQFFGVSDVFECTKCFIIIYQIKSCLIVYCSLFYITY